MGTATSFWRDVPINELEQTQAGFAELVPLQRLGTPEQVASAYIHLITNDFITGQVLPGRRRCDAVQIMLSTALAGSIPSSQVRPTQNRCSSSTHGVCSGESGAGSAGAAGVHVIRCGSPVRAPDSLVVDPDETSAFPHATDLRWRHGSLSGAFCRARGRANRRDRFALRGQALLLSRRCSNSWAASSTSL